MKIFDNIGGKIKTVAKVFFWIGTVISVLFSIPFFLEYAQLHDYSSSAATGSLITGILVLVLGPLATWLSVIMMYGFGQLVENSDVLTQMPSGRYYPPTAPVTPPARPAPVTPSAPVQPASPAASASPFTTATSASPAAPAAPSAPASPFTSAAPAASAAAGFMNNPCSRCHKTNVPIRSVTLKSGQSCVVCSDCFTALKEADMLK